MATEVLTDDQLKAAQERVATITTSAPKPPADAPKAPKPRKPRSDAGKPRTAKPKAPEPAPAVVSGGLTKDEASEIYTLSVKINVAIDNERLALSAYQDAVIETTHAKDALKERLKALTNDVLKAKVIAWPTRETAEMEKHRGSI